MSSVRLQQNDTRTMVWLAYAELLRHMYGNHQAVQHVVATAKCSQDRDYGTMYLVPALVSSHKTEVHITDGWQPGTDRSSDQEEDSDSSQDDESYVDRQWSLSVDSLQEEFEEAVRTDGGLPAAGNPFAPGTPPQAPVANDTQAFRSSFAGMSFVRELSIRRELNESTPRESARRTRARLQ